MEDFRIFVERTDDEKSSKLAADQQLMQLKASGIIDAITFENYIGRITVDKIGQAIRESGARQRMAAKQQQKMQQEASQVQQVNMQHERERQEERENMLLQHDDIESEKNRVNKLEMVDRRGQWKNMSEDKKNEFVRTMFLRRGLFQEEVMRTRFAVNSLDELEQEITALRGETSKAKAVESKVNEMRFKAPELATAFDAYINGQDYKRHLDNVTGGVDFNKTLAENGMENIIAHYSKGEFTMDEIRGYRSTDDKALKTAVTLSTEAFARDRDFYSSQRATADANNRNQQLEFNGSLDKSIEQLKKDFPKISQLQIDKLKSTFTSGGTNNFFFDRNGKVATDALKNLYALMYPNQFKGAVRKDLVEDKNNLLIKQIEGNSIREFTRTSSTLAPGEEVMANKLVAGLTDQKNKGWGQNTRENTHQRR